MLAVTSAQATLTVTEREIPVPASSAAVVDGVTEQYLYNVGAHGYFLGANDYETRASYSTTKGYKVRLTSTGDGSTISITDYVEKFNDWRKTFCDSPTGIWVDNNAGANCDTWVMTPVDGNVFTITNSADIFAGLLFGAHANAGDTRLYFKDPATEDFHTQWYTVSAEEYTAHLAKATLYEAAAPLWTLLVEADGLGIDVSAQEQVYANPDATANELAAAAEAVQNAIVIYNATGATADNPKDLTLKIASADFSENVGTGWIGTNFGFSTYANAEHYNKTYDTYQELTNLPNGVYALTSQAFYRAGWADVSYTNFVAGTEKNALLYAVNKVAAENASDTLTTPIVNVYYGIQPNNSLGGNELTEKTDGEYYIPNDMATAKTYFDAGYYADNKVLFAVTEGTALVGVKKEKTVSGDWSIFNNFGLKYYGNGADAYAFWNKDVMDAMPTYDPYGDVLVTASVVEAYEAVKANAVASTYEEVKNNIAAVNAAQALVEENIAAWKALQASQAQAMIVTSNSNYQGSDVDALADYCEFDLPDFMDARAASTEEVLAEAAKLKEMCETAIQNSIQPGTDVTELIKNADFSAGEDNWTFQYVSGGEVWGKADFKCAQAWNNADFDIYQIIEGAAVGAYKVTVQGFYRRGRGDNAWMYYFNSATGEKNENVEPAPAYVYVNEAKTPLMSVFEYAVPEAENYYEETGYNAAFKDQFGNYFPNSMQDAGLAFNRGEYVNEAIGLVAKKGDPLRIGMKGNTTQDGDSWAIFTRFKLVYMGFDVELLTEPLQTAIADIRTKISGLLGTEVKANAEVLAKQGEDALAAADGEAMNTALAAIYAYSDSVDASIDLFEALIINLDDIETIISESEAADDVKTDVAVTIGNISNAIDSYTNADVVAANATLAECRYKLALPAGYENASDAEPVDLTGLMQTPSFEKDGTNSLEGWEGTTGYNYGNDDTQKAALALEFYDKNFDMYQDITVPNGTYQISVNAFNRAGSTTADYAEYAAGTASKAQLYAKTGETEIFKAIEHLTSVEEAASEQLGLGSESNFNTNDGVTYYVPNDMVSSVAYFDQGRYINGITIKVTDGKLRVGIRQADKVSGSWVIMDAFKLMYLGAESQAEEGTWTAVEGVETAAEVKTIEVYSVDGIRQNSLQNGINIVVITDAEGNVTTKTVIK